jgi:hypothetical protein
MIKIFDSSGKVRPISSIKNSLKDSRKNSAQSKKNKRKKNNSDEVGRERLNLLNPMVVPILTLKSQNNSNNDFINKSIDVIVNNPHRLTEKWIASLNKWVDSVIKSMSLDPPNMAVDERHFIGPLVIMKISEANINDAYGTPSIIAVDDRGWKFYFKTSKAFSFKNGNAISLKAKISAHKEGITFLGRPSNIKLCDSDGTEVLCDSHKTESNKVNVISIFGDNQ